jgi:hypothetical protein
MMLAATNTKIPHSPTKYGDVVAAISGSSWRRTTHHW